MKTRKLDIAEKLVDVVECEGCGGSGCEKCDGQGGFMTPKQNWN